MKVPLKSNLFTKLLTIAIAAIVSFTSCNVDRCKTIVCANEGVCNMGVCTCPSGYEGTNCETVTRDKFTGNWMVFEKGSSTFSAQYPISIEPSSLITDVLIYNFNNYFKHPVLATISGYNITIPNQQLDGKIVFGKGYIYTPSNVSYHQYSAISMNYEVIDSVTLNIDDYGYNEVVDGSKPSAWNK